MPNKSLNVLSKVIDRIAEAPRVLQQEIAIFLIATRNCQTPEEAVQEAGKMLKLETAKDVVFKVLDFEKLDTNTPQLMFLFCANGFSIRLRGRIDESHDAHIELLDDIDWRAYASEVRAATSEPFAA